MSIVLIMYPLLQKQVFSYDNMKLGFFVKFSEEFNWKFVGNFSNTNWFILLLVSYIQVELWGEGVSGLSLLNSFAAI